MADDVADKGVETPIAITPIIDEIHALRLSLVKSVFNLYFIRMFFRVELFFEFLF